MKIADYPSFRLVIPLIGGVLLSNTFENTTSLVSLFCALYVIVSLITLLLFFVNKRISRFFGLFLSLSFLFLGAWISSRKMVNTFYSWPKEKRMYHAIITDYPSERDNSYRFSLMVVDSICHGRNIYLYVPKDSASKNMIPGEAVSFLGIVKEPENNESMADFDYAKYLYRHNICGTLWVSDKYWCKSLSTYKTSIKIRLLRFRMSLLNKYREWGMKDDVFAVVAAVSLGYKEQISDELKNAYSSSGASHVLAVSGLHVGIMCSFLSFLFPSCINLRKRRWIKEVVVMITMWTYSFAIGLPLSITRSMMMFSMLALCRSIGRDNSSINSIGLAALVILLINPLGLYDISFQLSFLAVFFILLLEPRITKIYKPRTIVGKYIWGIVSVSIAAQIGTSPIIFYYFSNFSTYFLLTNLFVIPLMFLIVSLSVVLWIVSFVPFLRMIIMECLYYLVTSVNEILVYVTQLPYSNFSIEINKTYQVWIIYALILLICGHWIEKKNSFLIHILFFALIWNLFAFAESLSNFFAV